MINESEALVQEMVKYCNEKGIMETYCDMQTISYYRKAKPEEVKARLAEIKSIYGNSKN